MEAEEPKTVTITLAEYGRLKHIEDRIRIMRTWQKAYFNATSRPVKNRALAASIKEEREIDRLLDGAPEARNPDPVSEWAKPEHVPAQMDTLIGALRRCGLEALAVVVEDDYEAEPDTFTPDFVEELARDAARIAVAIINQEKRNAQ